MLKFHRRGHFTITLHDARRSRHVVCIEARLAVRIAGVLWNVAARRCRRWPVFGPMPDQRLSDNPKTSTGYRMTYICIFDSASSNPAPLVPLPVTPLNRYRQTLTFREKEREKERIERERPYSNFPCF